MAPIQGFPGLEYKILVAGIPLHEYLVEHSLKFLPGTPGVPGKNIKLTTTRSLAVDNEVFNPPFTFTSDFLPGLKSRADADGGFRCDAFSDGNNKILATSMIKCAWLRRTLEKHTTLVKPFDTVRSRYHGHVRIQQYRFLVLKLGMFWLNCISRSILKEIREQCWKEG